MAFDVEFDQPVAGFDASALSLSGTAGPSTVVVSGGGSSYTVTVSGMTQDGTVIVTVAAGAVTAILAPNDPNVASTSTDNQVTYAVAAAAISTPSTATTLALTGADVGGLLGIGLALSVAGAGLVVAARRRRGTRARHS